MEQLLVPQFIDVEPKIFGPITVRQFIIMLVGFGLMFVEYKLLTFWAFVVAAVLTLAIFGIVAFLKINGQSFHYFLLNIFQTFKHPRLSIWRKEVDLAMLKKILLEQVKPPVAFILPSKRLVANSHLEELSLLVNTGGAYQPTSEDLITTYEKSEK